MLMPFPVLRIQLDGGKTAAFTASRGTRVRVVKGRVWATTTGNRDDVWIDAGQEHQVQKRGFTVLEAAAGRCATVELSPPANESRSTIRRVICAVAAAALTALTLVVFVVAPAQMSNDSALPQSAATARATATTLSDSESAEAMQR